mmetsp:Transcript_4964/g.16614  ORF Transcript_4964/g.16614 Transcript_4964/m.16614 type:complete len:129 (+) Transcript_4964:1475-1861(+)
MVSRAAVLLLIAGLGSAAAFRAPVRAASLRRVAPSPIRMAGRTNIREEKGYWPGEWVCADCGYIYAPSERVPFEELPRGFVCPQCAGPRRRFVKKAGDVVGSLDDSALTIGTIVGLVVVAGLLFVGLS